MANGAGTGALAVPSPEAIAAVLARHVDDLVEPAKVAAYEDLDEGRTGDRGRDELAARRDRCVFRRGGLLGGVVL